MAASKNPKDVIFVNYHEIPETICVETRLINQKNDPIFFFINKSANTIDLTGQEDQISANNFIPLPNILPNAPAVTLNLPANSTATQEATAQQSQPQQTQTVGTFVPLTSALPNFNNSSNSNSSGGKSLIPAVSIPLSSASQLQSFNLNTSVFPAAPLTITNNSNTTNVSRTFSDQIEQTDVSAFNMISIAIQCKLDDELECLDVEWPVQDVENLEIPENLETEKYNFIRFIKGNSTQHKGFKECLICGEVCKSNKYFYRHMAIHRGPKVLCFKCGQNLDHENLLVRHKCRKALQLEKAFLLCPHHSCSVKAISPLELYDHINEHANYQMYKCTACRKSFCTGQEFLRHLLIRAKCFTSAKKKRFRVYGLESQKDRFCRVRVFTLHTFKKCTTLVKTFLSQRVTKQGLCKICFRRFSNKSVYNRHRTKCITKFRKKINSKKN